MKKLKKMNLSSMDAIFSKLSVAENEHIKGGAAMYVDGILVALDNDCVLENISYITGMSLGDTLRAHARILQTELNISYSSALALSGTGTSVDSAMSILEKFTGDCSFTVFNPNASYGGSFNGSQYAGSIGLVSGSNGGQGHAFTVTNYLGNGVFEYWDEQNQSTDTISIQQIFALLGSR